MTPDPMAFTLQVAVILLLWEVWVRHWLFDED